MGVVTTLKICAVLQVILTCSLIVFVPVVQLTRETEQLQDFPLEKKKGLTAEVYSDTHSYCMH